MAEVDISAKATDVAKGGGGSHAPTTEKPMNTASSLRDEKGQTAKASSNTESASSGTGWWNTWMGLGKDDDKSTSRDGTVNDGGGGWLGGVGKAWEEAGGMMKDVGEKLLATVESVDLEAKSRQLREGGARLVGEVTEGMKRVELGEILDGQKLRGEAERLGREGRELWGKAGEMVGQKTREMRDILLDDGKRKQGAHIDGGGDGNVKEECLAPWDKKVLPEKERAYAAKLREEMGRIVVDAIYSKKKRSDLFLGGSALKAGYKFDFEGNAGMAKGALQADSNLRRLRAGLVPRKIREEEFWDAYFYHVDRVRRELVANNGEVPEAVAEEEDDPLFGDDDEDEEEVIAPLGEPGPRPKLEPLPKDQEDVTGVGRSDPKKDSTVNEEPGGSLGGGKRDWDEEIDKIFDAE